MAEAPSGISRRRELARRSASRDYLARREAIVHSAAIVFKELGLDRASLGDVAAALQVDRGSLYYYFGSKEELFHEVVRAAAKESVYRAEAISASEATTRDKIGALIEALMVSYEEQYPIHYVFIQERMDGHERDGDEWAVAMSEFSRRYNDAMTRVIQDGVDQGLIAADVDARLLAWGIIGMVNWTHRWFRPGQGATGRQIGQAYARMVLDGIFAGEGTLRGTIDLLVSQSFETARQRLAAESADRRVSADAGF